jgi:hypothetical protein|tara:strand:+ start:244 stop:525 length:282 start_codon:yes stop_codon:yes gene_type:complete
MSKLFFCEKNEIVWELTSEPKAIVIYKRDKDGNFIEDETGKYAVELDANDKIKKKIYNKTIHIYKGFPSYRLERKNMPSNENDEYYIDSSLTT